MQHTAVLPHCAAVVRLQYLFPTRPICIRNPPLPPPPPARHTLTHNCTHTWMAHLPFPSVQTAPLRLCPSLSLFSRARRNLRREPTRGRSRLVPREFHDGYGTPWHRGEGGGGRGGGRAKAPVSSRARQRINGAGLSSGFQSRGGGCCSRSSSSPLRYEAAFAAAERQRSRD